MADALSQNEGEGEIVELAEEATVSLEEPQAEGEATAEPELVETVIEDPDSQRERPKGGGYRRLISRLGKAKAETRDVSAELEQERQRRQLLEMALEQERGTKKGPPNPADFDEGAYDPKFAEAQRAYIDSLVTEKVQQVAPAAVPEVDRTLEQRQRSHADRAEALGLPDYADAQDKAIDILGPELANGIIKDADKSEIVLYYLGKNPGKAEEIADLFQTNPIKATLEIGRMEQRLQVTKKSAQTQPLPDPDREVQGADGAVRQSLRGPKGATFE